MEVWMLVVGILAIVIPVIATIIGAFWNLNNRNNRARAESERRLYEYIREIQKDCEQKRNCIKHETVSVREMETIVSAIKSSIDGLKSQMELTNAANQQLINVLQVASKRNT